MLEKLANDLKKRVSNERYNHVMRTLDMGEKLGKKNNAKLYDIRVALLFHDILKDESLEKQKELIRNPEGKKLMESLNIDEDMKVNILHGFAGAEYAKKGYNIENEDILNAIRYHTIGRENMSLLEKIVYLADGIEVGRKFSGVEEIRKMAYKDLNLGILMEINKKIEYLKKNNKKIHPNIYKMKDSIEKELKNK